MTNKLEKILDITNHFMVGHEGDITKIYQICVQRITCIYSTKTLDRYMSMLPKFIKGNILFKDINVQEKVKFVDDLVSELYDVIILHKNRLNNAQRCNNDDDCHIWVDYRAEYNEAYFIKDHIETMLEENVYFGKLLETRSDIREYLDDFKYLFEQLDEMNTIAGFDDIELEYRILIASEEAKNIASTTFERIKQENPEEEPYLSVLDRYNPVEGGETLFYYLRVEFRGKYYYKIGVTLGTVEERYTGYNNYEVIYAKRLTHARTIERQIKIDFEHSNFPLSLLGTNGTEVYDFDILELDVRHEELK